MMFYNEKQQMYPVTDASGISLGATVLQTRGGMLFPGNEAPKNIAVWP